MHTMRQVSEDAPRHGAKTVGWHMQHFEDSRDSSFDVSSAYLMDEPESKCSGASV